MSGEKVVNTGARVAMTDAERKEHARLRAGWATRKLTKGQMLRCMELDRRAEQVALAGESHE